jgi:hypothetical protein
MTRGASNAYGRKRIAPKSVTLSLSVHPRQKPMVNSRTVRKNSIPLRRCMGSMRIADTRYQLPLPVEALAAIGRALSNHS